MSLSEARTLRNSTPSTIPELAILIKNISMEQNKKFDDLNKQLDSKINKLQVNFNNQIAELTSTFNAKLEGLMADVDSKLSSNIKEIESRILAMETQQISCNNDIERRATLCDLIVNGIPFIHGENITNIVEKILTKCGISNSQIVATSFRIPPKSSSSILTRTPIVIRCFSPAAKQLFLSKYFMLKKLFLSDIGFDSGIERIFINESLTKLDTLVMKQALALKKMGKILNVGSKNGQVIIKVAANDKYISVNLNDLHAL